MRLKALLGAALACAACVGSTPVDEARVLDASYAEGALWQDGRLYFAEMGADRVSSYEGGVRGVFFFQEGCGPTAIAPYGPGFVVLCHISARVVAVAADGREWRRWDRDRDGARFRGPNDVTADGRGGVYFSDPGLFSRRSRPHGTVLHLSAEGEVARVAGPLWYPNGVFADRAHDTLYVDEHLGGRVLRYSMLPDGRLTGPSLFVDINHVERRRRYRDAYPEAGPDGVEVGPDGHVYVAIYGEGRVMRFTPEGRLAGFIETPSRFTTSIGFNAAGDAAVTSVFENDRAPYAAEVRVFSRAALTRAIR